MVKVDRRYLHPVWDVCPQDPRIVLVYKADHVRGNELHHKIHGLVRIPRITDPELYFESYSQAIKSFEAAAERGYKAANAQDSSRLAESLHEISGLGESMGLCGVKEFIEFLKRQASGTLSDKEPCANLTERVV